MIWPNRNHFKIAYSGTGLKNACVQLESDAASLPVPTEDSLKLVNFMLSRASEAPTSLIPSVCRAAISWNDWALWDSTLENHFWIKDQPSLNDSDLSDALRTFGFELTRKTYVIMLSFVCYVFTLLTAASFEHALRTSASNKSRIQLLSAIESLLGQVEESEKASVSPWLDQEKADMFRKLKKIEKDEAELIVSSSLSYGGAKFLAEWSVDFLSFHSDSVVLTA